MRLSPSAGAACAAACLLAAIAANGFAQPELEPTASAFPDRLSVFLENRALAEQRIAAIRDEEAANGPYSPALIDQLKSLALLYLEIGDSHLAAESFRKALQIERANFGLFSLDQVPLIEQLIEAERARGNLAAAAELERRLLALAYHHPEDLRSAEILREAGDRQLALYDLYVERKLPPEININLGFAGPSARNRPPPGRFAVLRAQQHYFDAIGVLLRTGSYGHDALPELERKLLHTYYLELTESGPESLRVDRLSTLGRQAHERLIAYEALNEGTLEDIARAHTALADWKLLFSHNGAALDHYRQVYAILVDAEGHEALLGELFAPESPIMLPTFVQSPLVAAHSGDERYVEVAFVLSRYGKSRAVEVIGTSGAPDKDAVKAVTRLISRSRFRPIFRNGEPASAAPVVVRYRF